MKKILSIIIILVIITTILLISLKGTSPFKNFQKNEQKWIQTLTKEEQQYFLDHKNLYSLLKEKEFKTQYFSNYIKLYQSHQELSNEQIIFLVNLELLDEELKHSVSLLTVKHVELKRMKRYLAYQKQNDSLTNIQIVTLVNQDIDTIMMNYHSSIEPLLKEPYFIKKNLERYINYQEKNNTPTSTTVAYVNTNLDYDYYTNTKDSNLDKKNLVIVNKYYSLKNDYIPEDLVTIESRYGNQLQIDKTTYEAFKTMADKAKKENLTLYIQSPYRSYNTQANLYQRYCNQDGKALADTYSARPGYSEHQTGLAVDIVNGAGKALSSFEKTKEFLWMQAHAHQYGFILRYPEGKELITGYQYEPWHYRYVGVDVASKVHELGITYDEYYAYYIEQ